MWSLVALIAIVSQSLTQVVSAINYTQYFAMPPLNLLDNYDQCIVYADNFATYCFVDSTIEPQSSSNLWNYIEDFSKDQKRHYRHDRLQRGVCINSCRALMDTFSESSREKFYLADFGANITVHFGPQLYKNSLFDGIKYNKLINQCVNHELRKYGLKAYSTIEYCVTNQADDPLDALDWSFLLLTSSILILVIVATVYDSKRKQVFQSQHIGAVNYFDERLNTNVSQVICAFSLPRNWKLLTETRKNTKSFDNLEFVDGIKFLMMQWIITGHNLYFRLLQPMVNPEFFEIKIQNSPIVYFLNAYSLVWSFFIISGVMQGMKYIKYMAKHKKIQWNYVWKSVLYRYFRLTPLYAYVIFFYATVFVRIQDGPFWLRIQQPEKSYCRKNYWANLLFINNHYDTKKLCLMESWFLAVDFQLHLISTVVLLVVWKFPKQKFIILFFVAVTTCLIPGIVSYVNNLEGILLLQPESIKYNMIDSQMFRQLYTPAHVNMGSFFVGTLGIFMLQVIYARNITFHSFKKFKWLFGLITAILFLAIASGFIYYKYDFEKSSIINPIFITAQKTLWGIFALLFYMGLVSKVGGVVRSFLKIKFFNVLGKLTFSAYLCHLIVIKYMVDASRQPIHVKLDTMYVTQCLAIFLAYCVALALCLIIEYPAVALLKMVLGAEEGRDLKPVPSQENNQNGEMLEINTTV